MIFRYDEHLLKLVSVDTTSWTSGFMSDFHDGDGVVRIGMAGTRGLEGHGVLADITFDILPDVQEGTICFLELTLFPNEEIAPHSAMAGMKTSRHIPTEFGLAQNYPNPFNPTTDISYQIADQGPSIHSTLKIYNMLGQEVRTLVDRFLEPGYYLARWDGRDEHGREVTSGVYFYRMVAGPYASTRRMVLLK
jgi:hypothetical protein